MNLGDIVIDAMLWLTRFEQAIAERYSTNPATSAGCARRRAPLGSREIQTYQRTEICMNAREDMRPIVAF